MTDPRPPRTTRRGRPQRTSGDYICGRCQRPMGKPRVRWVGEALCNSCYYTAMRTHGQCPSCGHEGVLPGRRKAGDDRPVCLPCAGVNDAVVRCRCCAQEGEMYRRGLCARCALRHDLQYLAGPRAGATECASLIGALCAVDRPESILTWKRSPAVHALLAGLLGGTIAFTHQALDKRRAHSCRRTPAQHLDRARPAPPP